MISCCFQALSMELLVQQKGWIKATKKNEWGVIYGFKLLTYDVKNIYIFA